MKQREWKSPTIELNALPEPMFAVYDSERNVVVLDAQKLSQSIIEKIKSAKRVKVDLGNFETVFVAKFASVVSHEMIHKVLHDIGDRKVSRSFDSLYLAEFMEKIPEDSIHMVLWSDALETCPIGDTWFS
jgi:glutamine phosphoribosylpyrophosphate amidotransferase